MQRYRAQLASIQAKSAVRRRGGDCRFDFADAKVVPIREDRKELKVALIERVTDLFRDLVHELSVHDPGGHGIRAAIRGFRLIPQDVSVLADAEDHPMFGLRGIYLCEAEGLVGSDFSVRTK